METQEESFDAKKSALHTNSEECQCPECNENKRRYIQIIDVHRYVNALNDWD